MNKSFIFSCLFCATIPFNTSSFANEGYGAYPGGGTSYTTFPTNTISKLTKVLQKYCVPDNASVCDSKYRATFNESFNTCECKSCGLFYNEKTRLCEQCPKGTYTTDRHSSECLKIDCGGGYRVVLMEDTKTCPKGYKKIKVSICN